MCLKPNHNHQDEGAKESWDEIDELMKRPEQGDSVQEKEYDWNNGFPKTDIWLPKNKAKAGDDMKANEGNDKEAHIEVQKAHIEVLKAHIEVPFRGNPPMVLLNNSTESRNVSDPYLMLYRKEKPELPSGHPFRFNVRFSHRAVHPPLRSVLVLFTRK